MTEEQFRNEHSYLTALSMVDALREKKLVTAEEYESALKILYERFRPLVDKSLIVSST